MDALRSDTLHPSESAHSLSCVNTNHTDTLSKEREEELLYGTGDDGDEEDALSDDSMRLRLSDDDEIEAEVISAATFDNQENRGKNNEIEIASGNEEDTRASPVLEENIMKGSTTSLETKQEEHCSGNVSSMDEQIVFHHEKDVKGNENGLTRLQTSTMPRSWPNYDPQWRFSRNPGIRSFYNVNHPLYNRCRYLTPRGHFRHQLYEYNTRFHNAFLPFERGRGNGMFNTYNRSMYGNRHPKQGLASAPVQKLNNSIELEENLTSSSNTNASSKHQVNTIRNVQVSNDSSVGKNNILHSETLANTNNDQTNKLLNEQVAIGIENVHEGTSDNTDPLNPRLKSVDNLKVCTQVIASNGTNSERNVGITEIGTSNGNSNKLLANSAINPYDYKQANKIGTRDVNNANSGSKAFCVSDNSKTMQTLSSDVRCDKSEPTVEIGADSSSNAKKTETDKANDLNATEGKGEGLKAIYKIEGKNGQSVELSEENCVPLVLDTSKEDVIEVNNELTEKGSTMDHKIKEILGSKEDRVSLESNESCEDSTLKGSHIVLNNLINQKNDNEMRIIQGDSLKNPITDTESGDSKQCSSGNYVPSASKMNKSIIPEESEENIDTIQKHTNSVKKDNLVISSAENNTMPIENIESISNQNVSYNVKPQLNSLSISKDNSVDNAKRTNEVPVATHRKRRRTKKMIAAAQEAVAEGDKQAKESGRQKRQTAKNAEKIIREEFLLYDSDLEFSDTSEKLVAINYKMNQDARPLSPPSLKRNCPDIDSAVTNGAVKKVKIKSAAPSNDVKRKENDSENVKKLNYIHKFFQRDLNEKLPKLKQEELEELLIQKIVETITMRDEIGRLREQARISERNQEITRAKCQQLAKQIKDFEMVLNRNAADRRANNDKPTPPIKINRSVGLQVNFITDHGMQNLRQLQQTSNIKSLHISSSSLTSNTSNNEMNNTTSLRRGIKVRSPRRTDTISGQTPGVSQNSTQSSTIMPTITPAALVVAKPVDAQHSLALSNQSNVQQIMQNEQLQHQPQQQPQQQQSSQAIVLNGKFPNQTNRQGSSAVNVAKSRTNDLIDLTDEEEKSKGSSVPAVANTITDQQANLTQKSQPCFQRVIQTIPGNVAITSQPPSIRVVQPASQPTPTALVNNMNAPRLAYVMQSSVGPTRQLLITPTSSPMRPVTSCRASFSTLTYKTGISTIANGTVRVLTTSATSNIQLNKHPAPLPDTRNYTGNPLWKLPPPAPSLKISKVANGIILSWNMNLSDKYADIASYQLYAYQEISGVPPNTSLWKKVGDVRALPLPMACTLTQFSEGNNYYFAVRAVDTHSRKGQYSIPGNISL